MTTGTRDSTSPLPSVPPPSSAAADCSPLASSLWGGKVRGACHRHVLVTSDIFLRPSLADFEGGMGLRETTPQTLGAPENQRVKQSESEGEGGNREGEAWHAASL